MTAIGHSNGQPKTLWKEQAMTPQTFSAQTLAEKARAHEKLIGRRNLREYIAGGLAGAFFLVIVAIMLANGIDSLADGVRVTGFGLAALASGFVVFQLRRRTALPAPDASPTARALRGDLVRQRDALDTAWLWYFAPFLPGFFLIYGADLFIPGADLIVPAALLAATLALFAGLIWLNRVAARQFDAEIAALDAAGD